MQWQGRRESDNVEDRRRSMAPGGLALGGVGTIVVVLLYLALGGDPRQLMQPGALGPGAAVSDGPPIDEADEELVSFVRVVLADTEDVWHRLFSETDRQYREPKLVLFKRRVESACGFASAAVGPFYCPADQQVYLDLEFFEELRHRFKAPGDFAEAYVIAHEVGHHVQKLLGVSDEVHRQQQLTASKPQKNRLSVRLELQADFLAGVWAHHVQKEKRILDPGDLDEAIQAASAIGDDRLQRESQGYVVPDSFTHGTSTQRIGWFRRGFQTGDFASRDQLFDLDYDAL